MTKSQEVQKQQSSSSSNNKKMATTTAKKFKGVRMRTWGSWVSEIRAPNQKTRIWLGSYSTAEAAARAYDAALLCLKGTASAAPNLNFPISSYSHHHLNAFTNPPMSPKSIQRVAAAAATTFTTTDHPNPLPLPPPQPSSDNYNHIVPTPYSSSATSFTSSSSSAVSSPTTSDQLYDDVSLSQLQPLDNYYEYVQRVDHDHYQEPHIDVSSWQGLVDEQQHHGNEQLFPFDDSLVSFSVPPPPTLDDFYYEDDIRLWSFAE